MAGYVLMESDIDLAVFCATRRVDTVRRELRTAPKRWSDDDFDARTWAYINAMESKKRLIETKPPGYEPSESELRIARAAYAQTRKAS